MYTHTYIYSVTYMCAYVEVGGVREEKKEKKKKVIH